MPVKWTKPKTQPKAEKPKGDNKPKGESKPKGGKPKGKPKGKPANAKAAADKKEAK